jgi:hypothetical protein
MARKKPSEPIVARPDANWVISTEITLNNRSVVKNTELKISGQRGRFRFIKHVVNGEYEWIDVYGGPKGSESIRSFRPERVKTVHSKNQTGKNLLAARKSS